MKKKAAKTAKKKTGRPPYIENDEDRNKVKLLCIIGTPVKTIAEILGVCKDVLYRHYKKEIQQAAQEANAQVAANLFKQTKTNPAAAIFWMKTRCGWREKDDASQTVIPINITYKRGAERPSAKKIEENSADGTNG